VGDTKVSRTDTSATGIIRIYPKSTQAVWVRYLTHNAGVQTFTRYFSVDSWRKMLALPTFWLSCRVSTMYGTADRCYRRTVLPYTRFDM
jgi:hypothetical protein